MATTTEILRFLIRGDGSDAINSFRQVGAAARTNLGTIDNKLAQISTSTKGSAGFLEQTFGRALGQVGVDAKGLSAALGPGTGVAGATAGLVAAFALLGGVGVKEFQGLAQAVLKFQRVAGTTAEESSRFVEVLSDYKISADFAAVAVSRLAKASSIAPGSLERLGVEIARTSSGGVNLEATLVNVAEAYASHEDDAKKAELATRAFGRGYQQLIPVLEKGAEGLRASLSGVGGEQILSQADLRRAEDLRLTFDELRDTVSQFTLSVGSALVPALTDAVAALNTIAATANSALGPVGGLGGAIKFGVDHIVPFTATLNHAGDIVRLFADDNQNSSGAVITNARAISVLETEAGVAAAALDLLGDSLDGAFGRAAVSGVVELGSAAANTLGLLTGLSQSVAGSAVDAAVAGIDLLAEALGDAERRAQAAAEEIERIPDLLLDVEGAALSVQSAEFALADAFDALAVAQEVVTNGGYTLLELQELQAEHLRDITEAEEDYRKALEAITEAQEDAVDAQQNLVDAREDAGRAGERVRDAEAKAADALLDVAAATDAATLAREKYNQILAGFGADSAEGRTAAEEVDDTVRARKRAELDLAEAQQEVINRQFDYNTAVAEHGATSEIARTEALKVADAQQDVVDAQDELQASVEDAEKAQQAYNETVNGATPASEAATEAAEDLSDAEKDLKRAQDAAKAAQEAVTQAHKDAAKAIQGLDQAYGRLEEANEQVQEATQAAQAAQQTLIDTQGRAVAPARDLEAAQRALQRAEWDVANASYNLEVRLVEQRNRLNELRGAQWLAEVGASNLGTALLNIPTNIHTSVTLGTQGVYDAIADITSAVGDMVADVAGSIAGSLFGGVGGFRSAPSTSSRAGGATNITYNVYMPPGSDGNDVVAALKRWTQRNGSLSREVTL